MESAMLCTAQKDSEKKIGNNSLSTSWDGLCAETQLGEASCTKEQKESNTVHAHKVDADEP